MGRTTQEVLETIQVSDVQTEDMITQIGTFVTMLQIQHWCMLLYANYSLEAGEKGNEKKEFRYSRHMY